MQSNPLLFNPIEFNTIKLNAMQYNKMQYDVMQSVGMVICDMSVPGCPLAHLNTAFSDLTGYQKDKIGTNCKFLQVRTLSGSCLLSLFLYCQDCAPLSQHSVPLKSLELKKLEFNLAESYIILIYSFRFYFVCSAYYLSIWYSCSIRSWFDHCHNSELESIHDKWLH